jgi:Cu2+-exporting ATPase
MLLFFLLIGRTLDHVMRAKARAAVGDLAKLTGRGATVERADGTRAYLPVTEIEPGMIILLAAGERAPVDACVLAGTSDLDRSLVTGESLPRAVVPGLSIEAGTLNLTAPLRLEAAATASESFLAEMVRLMTAAEAGRSSYRRLADRAAALYAPLVHGAALLTFLGWAFTTGDVHRAVTIAVAVLIITCPCALGLAVPIVQVVAARRLFEHGIMIKDGAGLERLAEADAVVFDKTGTLTLGTPVLRAPRETDPGALALAAALAAYSRHPHSRALVAAHATCGDPEERLDVVSEVPGQGLEARCEGDIIRLGRADWALGDSRTVPTQSRHPCSVLSRNGQFVAAFAFDDQLRPGARKAVAALMEQGFAVGILSGDHAPAVESVAGELGITRFEPNIRPGDKLDRLTALAAAGHKTLMLGDGLNDAPALAAAHVSMAPSSAVDVGRNAADFVFMRDGLDAVPFAVDIARRARRLISQNFVLAVLYNAVALPFAIAGFVTPLAAALAMSGSSLIVMANAMRLSGGISAAGKRRERSGRQAGSLAGITARCVE